MRGSLSNIARRRNCVSLERVHAQLEKAAAAGDVDRYFDHNHVPPRRAGVVAQPVGCSASPVNCAACRSRGTGQLTVPGDSPDRWPSIARSWRRFRAGDAKSAQQAMEQHLCRQQVLQA